MSVRDAYEYGECPECRWPIPVRAANGQGCSNCGHVFFSAAYTRRTLRAQGDLTPGKNRAQKPPPTR